MEIVNLITILFMDVKYVEVELVNYDYLLICFFIFTYSF